MADINLLLADMCTEITNLNRKWVSIVEALWEESDYVTLDDAMKISGYTKRQLRYKADNGQIKTRRVNERTRLYCRSDLEPKPKTRR